MARKWIRVRKYFHEYAHSEWAEVCADIIKYRGIRYAVHKRVDGGKGYQVTEWLTGLKVCNLDMKKDAPQRIAEMHDSCAQIVNKFYRDGKYAALFQPCANEMTNADYEALLAGVYGLAEGVQE